MNELTTLTDAQLDKAIENLKERELAAQTESGHKYVVSKMREIIMYLEEVGYTTDANEKSLAELWAISLTEDFVRLGAEGMKRAVVQWVANDDSEYHSFPKIPWIKEACAQVGGDPRVEKGRRIQVETERKMQEDHRKEMERIKREHPDLWKKVEEKVDEIQKRQENREEVKITL